MQKLVMYCKTYSGDKNIFDKMLKSFIKYNKDNIKLIISVPNDEIEMFKAYETENIEVISDESYAGDYLIKDKLPDHGLSVGYVNQEICKLCFWESNLCENYFCIDSDVEFIRDFYIADFMADENTPYTVLVQDKDLAIEKHYQDFWDGRQNFIQKIYNEVGLVDKRLRTCHGMQILNCKVLQSLKNDFMREKNYNYADLLNISPFEFSWYNAWFQKCKLVEEYAIEPLVKIFHMREDYEYYQMKNISNIDIKRSYIGIVFNSNWRKEQMEQEKSSVKHFLFNGNRFFGVYINEDKRAKRLVINLFGLKIKIKLKTNTQSPCSDSVLKDEPAFNSSSDSSEEDNFAKCKNNEKGCVIKKIL